MSHYFLNTQLSNPNPAVTLKVLVSLSMAGALLMTTPLYAEPHDGHGEHSSAEQPSGDNPAVAAYQAASDRMHENMAMSLTGDPDVDFAQGMIPHHEGAIAMAEVALEYGEDEQIRQLAEEIIAAQESEIAFLREWLEENGQ